MNLEEKYIKLQIWDTAGQERFRTISKNYYRRAHGVILIYDINDENSFKNIRNWLSLLEENVQNNVCKVLVGNKCDSNDRKISYEEGEKLSKEFKMQFFETSAKTNYNVNETFIYLTRDILSLYNNLSTSLSENTEKKQLMEGKPKLIKKCCK